MLLVHAAQGVRMRMQQIERNATWLVYLVFSHITWYTLNRGKKGFEKGKLFVRRGRKAVRPPISAVDRQVTEKLA